MKFKHIILTLLVWPLSSLVWTAEVPVSLQLLWKHQFQFAGYYVAKERGFYKEAGLDVEIKEFSNQTDLVGDVVNGNNTFAVGRSSLIVDKGRGSPIVALMAAFQQSPLMLITKTSSGIETPQDLKGQRVMITKDAEQVAEILAMMLRQGVREADFDQQDHSFNLEDLVNGVTDAYGAYLSNEPYQLQQRGIPYHVLHPRDFGFDMYSDILFTSERYLAEHPEKVQAFLHATIRGWEHAFEHIDDTAELIFQNYNSQSRSLGALKYEGRVLKELAYAGTDQFGEINALRFQQMANIYLVTGALGKEYSLDSFVYQPPKLSTGIQLSQGQAHYLFQRPSLKMCVNPSAMPYDGIINGRHQGVVFSYMARLAELLGIQLQLVPTLSQTESLRALEEGRCQLLAGTMQTPQRSEKLRYSRPYLSTPIGLATQSGSTIDIGQGPFAVAEGTAQLEVLSNRYPSITLVEVADIEEGFAKLDEGEVQGVVAARAILESAMQRGSYGDIEIGNQLNDNWDLSIAARLQDQRLVDIFNIAISHLNSLDHQSIRRQWIKEPESVRFNMRLFWQIFSGTVLLLIFLGYRYKVVNDYNRRLKQLAAYDQLTGVSNRHALSSKLNDHISIANRYGRKLSVIFFDVDNFKNVNDTLGHIAGDEVLMGIASSVLANIRKADILGRWGGDEFMILLPEQDVEQACVEAEKLRVLIANHHFPFGGRVSCSFGVAQYHPGMDEDALVTTADKALYKAKENGRNQVISAGITPPPQSDLEAVYEI
ncbi:MAG: ABC transporter substrate-binding protein [Motiliproteus sp.]|nr:ABC transporter substrate-binding protein [Motiliproteus sp.]